MQKIESGEEYFCSGNHTGSSFCCVTHLCTLFFMLL